VGSEWQPQAVMMDMEQAYHNSIGRVFDPRQTRTLTCLFHVLQQIQRQLHCEWFFSFSILILLLNKQKLELAAQFGFSRAEQRPVLPFASTEVNSLRCCKVTMAQPVSELFDSSFLATFQLSL
jgi:hypothetical protein